MTKAELLGWPTREQIAGAIANARGGRRGVPEITNVLDLLPAKLREEVLDDADAVLALFPPVADGWRTDMENAPRDGTRVLLCDRSGNLKTGRWIGAPHSHFTEDGFRTVDRPTAWRLLPPPPGQE